MNTNISNLHEGAMWALLLEVFKTTNTTGTTDTTDGLLEVYMNTNSANLHEDWIDA